MIVFLLFIMGFGWIFSQYFQEPSILIFAVIFSLIMNFTGFWYSDKVILSLVKAKPIEKKDNPELYRVVENLCITAGLPLPKICIIPEDQPNAFATGRDKNHAVVAVTQGLLQKLNKTELEGVIAHELSHIGNRDILLMAMIVVLVGFVSIISDFFLRASLYHGQGGRRERKGSGGSILPLIGLILAILSPIVATLIHLAVSRGREFLADSSGALLTRYPEGLARALEKIAGDLTPMKTGSKATAHLFISDPFKKKISSLFMTHPPVEERVKILRGMKA